MYIYRSKDVMNIPLISKDEEQVTRLSLVKNLIFEESIGFDGVPIEKIDKKIEILEISLKEFSFGENIFTRSNQIWSQFVNRTSKYKYDGLIYTPINLPVGFSDSLNYDLNTNNTWFMNLKWKPP